MEATHEQHLTRCTLSVEEILESATASLAFVNLEDFVLDRIHFVVRICFSF